MSVREAISVGTTLPPAAGIDAVPLAQVTSERLGLTVAALIALAVLAVLGGVLVELLRRRAQARALGRHDGAEPGARPQEAALWSAGGATGAGARAEAGAAAEPARAEEGAPVRDEEEAPGEDAGAVAATAGPLPGTRPEPVADEPAEPVEPSPPAGEGLVVRPPLPREAWVAEIVWAAHATRFRVVARRSDDPEAEPVAIAQTEPLPWPPRDDASVQALTDASATLESVLLDSGWTGLPTGQAWYSKRFAWAAQDVAPEAPRPTGRFDRRRTQAPEPVPPAPVARDAGPLPQ